MEVTVRCFTIADCANAGEESDPVRGQDENEQSRQKRETATDHVLSNNRLKKPVKTLDDRLAKILKTARNQGQMPQPDLNRRHQNSHDDEAEKDRISKPTEPINGLASQGVEDVFGSWTEGCEGEHIFYDAGQNVMPGPIAMARKS
jgi:hypothetical protein